MADINLSTVIGSSGSSFIMPQLTTIDANAISIKTSATIDAPGGSAAFWTALAVDYTNRGFDSTVYSATADTTEQTVLDIVSGSGVLTHVLSPALSAAGTMTIRVTRDGEVLTFISTNLSVADISRLAVGHFAIWGTQITAGNGSGNLGGTTDRGYTIAERTTMTTPPQAVLEGIGIPFKSSLKVTIQGSVNITATAELLKAAACINSTIPEGV